MNVYFQEVLLFLWNLGITVNGLDFNFCLMTFKLLLCLEPKRNKDGLVFNFCWCPLTLQRFTTFDMKVKQTSYFSSLYHGNAFAFILMLLGLDTIHSWWMATWKRKLSDPVNTPGRCPHLSLVALLRFAALCRVPLELNTWHKHRQDVCTLRSKHKKYLPSTFFGASACHK